MDVGPPRLQVFTARPKPIEQWKFDRGFRLLLSVLTGLEEVSRDLRDGGIDAIRARCEVYRCRIRIKSALAFLAETPLSETPVAWRHVREEAAEADECLAYALESLEYEESGSAGTDLSRAIENLRLLLFTIRTRSTLRFRSWPFDPWRSVARRLTNGDGAQA